MIKLTLPLEFATYAEAEAYLADVLANAVDTDPPVDPPNPHDAEFAALAALPTTFYAQSFDYDTRGELIDSAAQVRYGYVGAPFENSIQDPPPAAEKVGLSTERLTGKASLLLRFRDCAENLTQAGPAYIGSFGGVGVKNEGPAKDSFYIRYAVRFNAAWLATPHGGSVTKHMIISGVNKGFSSGQHGFLTDASDPTQPSTWLVRPVFDKLDPWWAQDVTLKPDTWYFVQHKVSKQNDELKAWICEVGQPPVLFSGALPAGIHPDMEYTGFQALLRPTDGTDQPFTGDLCQWIDQILVSDVPLPMGGYEIPYAEDGALPGGGPVDPPTDGEHPAWIDEAIANGWAVGTWAAISGPVPTHGLSPTNAMRAVKSVNQNDHKFQGTFRDYSGVFGRAPALGAFGSYVAGMGGAHGGYYGNDAFAFDIDSRMWSETAAATAEYLWADGNEFGEFHDGKPLCTHTYTANACTGALPGYPAGLMIHIRAVSDQGPGTVTVATPYPHWKDLSNPDSAWVRGDIIPEHLVRTSWRNCPAGVWDETRKRYFFWATTFNSVRNLAASWNPLAPPGSQWTVYPVDVSGGSHTGGDIEQCMAHDPVRDIYIYTSFRNAKNVRYVRADNPSAFNEPNRSAWIVNETGDIPPKLTASSFVYAPGRDAFLHWSGDGNVWQLKRESGDTYRWTNLTAGTAVVPAATRVYNQLQVFTYGAVEIAVAASDVDGPVYAFRLS